MGCILTNHLSDLKRSNKLWIKFSNTFAFKSKIATGKEDLLSLSKSMRSAGFLELQHVQVIAEQGGGQDLRIAE
jgi:hypothetical protein